MNAQKNKVIIRYNNNDRLKTPSHNAKTPVHVLMMQLFTLIQVVVSSSSGGSDLLLLLARCILRVEVGLCRSDHTDTLLGEAATVDRAVEALLNRVPTNDALKMGAESAEGLDVSVVVLVNSQGLLRLLY